MASNSIQTVNRDLLKLATAHTQQLIDRAAADFNITRVNWSIAFDLKGKGSGQMKVVASGKVLIRYNPILLHQNPDDFIAQTVPHEVSHLIAYLIHGPSIKPHGVEWRRLMAYFDVPAKVHHQYSTADCQFRQLQRFDYQCECSTHQLTSIRHNRAQQGVRYFCRRCGVALTPRMGS